MATERDQLDEMKDGELVAYWNILQMGGRMLQSADAAETNARHTPIVDELLTEREIPHETGKLIDTVLVDRETGKVIHGSNGQPVRQKAA